jgi:hypothetical protein
MSVRVSPGPGMQADTAANSAAGRAQWIGTFGGSGRWR